MAENLNLKKTILIEDKEYDINAVYSDEAGKVTTPLVIKESLATSSQEGSYNGDATDSTIKEINYVPATGGKFNGIVHVYDENRGYGLGTEKNPIEDSEVLNYKQIETVVSDLKGNPLWKWDPTDSGYTAMTGGYQDAKIYGLNTVIGKVEDLPVFEAYATGEAHSLYVTPDSYDKAYITYSNAHIEYDNDTISYDAYFNSAYKDIKNNITKLVFKGEHTNEENFKADIRIRGSEFYNMTSLAAVHLNPGVVELGTKAFSGCSALSSIAIPNSVEFIGKEAFSGCTSLTSIVLGSNIKEIKASAFSGCKNLKSIAICNNSVSIDVTAFEGCTSLKTVYFKKGEKTWNTTLTAKSKTGASTDANIVAIGSMVSPFLYICKADTEDTSLTSNKMFLKLPGEALVEISKGATRLERRDSKTSGNVDYFTYDVLAAVIAGINSRITALGSKALALPEKLKIYDADTTAVLDIPVNVASADEDKSIIVEETVVPSVQVLSKRIDSIELTETKVSLAEDLYTYVPIGNAQKASNEVIGSGSTISATNRGKLGSGPKYDNNGNLISVGDSLKSVFNKIFGTQTDTQPNVNNSNVKLNVSPDTTSYGSSTTEYGTPINAKDVTITFTLANSGTAQYGYRCGNTKTTGSQTFYYPVTKQSTGSSTSGKTSADIKITLPTGKTASSSMVTAGTYVHHNNNVLYCNFNGSNQVSIKISLAAGSVTTSQQTRYGQISASVTLGAAQKENKLTVGTAITAFLTYLKEDADDQSKLSITAPKSNTAGSYTIAAGKYYNYYLTSTERSISNDTSAPVTTATQFSSSTISIPCTDASHIWFLLPPGTSGNKSIQYEPFANTWVDAFGGATDTTVGPVDVALKLGSGSIVTYNGYYTSAKAAAGSSLNYKIV